MKPEPRYSKKEFARRGEAIYDDQPRRVRPRDRRAKTRMPFDPFRERAAFPSPHWL
jgi:hypothetical protein